MSKKQREKRGSHFVLNPTPISEAIVQGLAMQLAQHLVKAQDAQPKIARKIGEADFRLED